MQRVCRVVNCAARELFIAERPRPVNQLHEQHARASHALSKFHEVHHLSEIVRLDDKTDFEELDLRTAAELAQKLEITLQPFEVPTPVER